MRLGVFCAEREERVQARRGRYPARQAHQRPVAVPLAAEGKRARRRQRGRGVLEFALDVLAEVIGGFWP